MRSSSLHVQCDAPCLSVMLSVTVNTVNTCMINTNRGLVIRCRWDCLPPYLLTFLPPVLHLVSRAACIKFFDKSGRTKGAAVYKTTTVHLWIRNRENFVPSPNRKITTEKHFAQSQRSQSGINQTMSLCNLIAIN